VTSSVRSPDTAPCAASSAPPASRTDSLQVGLWRLRRDASRLMVELDAAKEHKAKLMAAKAEEAAGTQLAA
jgi:hypothetical protein